MRKKKSNKLYFAAKHLNPDTKVVVIYKELLFKMRSQKPAPVHNAPRDTRAFFQFSRDCYASLTITTIILAQVFFCTPKTRTSDWNISSLAKLNSTKILNRGFHLSFFIYFLDLKRKKVPNKVKLIQKIIIINILCMRFWNLLDKRFTAQAWGVYIRLCYYISLTFDVDQLFSLSRIIRNHWVTCPIHKSINDTFTKVYTQGKEKMKNLIWARQKCFGYLQTKQHHNIMFKQFQTDFWL